MYKKIYFLSCLFCLLFGAKHLFAQQKQITGVVSDYLTQETLPGVSIALKGTTLGTITDVDGNYLIRAQVGDTLVFTYIGYVPEEVIIGEPSIINISMSIDIIGLKEIVVIGYGVQKKESVVGSIVQTGSEEIKRAATSSTDLANSLTGLLPGVITVRTSGIPGGEGIDDRATEIFIRGRTTWNQSQPLVLVDGVERKMMDIDPNEVETISVLKDASATAVFGVKGANGVVLITTKRGKSGKPKLSFESQVSSVSLSKLDPVLNSYDARYLKNFAIINELGIDPNSWADFTPPEILNYYRDGTYPELYADVNWRDELTRDFSLSQRHNLNVAGGTDFVKYFLSLGYLSEGDIMRTQDFGQGYSPEFKYDRYNFRSNLDFDLTKTTRFSVNLSGFYGQQQRSAGNRFNMWKGIYGAPPDLYPPIYEDGTWAHYSGFDRYTNPLYELNIGGIELNNRSEINTDFKLSQKLDRITKGLSVNAQLSYDNRLLTRGPDISDPGELRKWINPRIVDAQNAADSARFILLLYPQAFTQTSHGYNFVKEPLSREAERIRSQEINGLYRALFYQASVNYAREFGRHSVTGLALFNRRENVIGSAFTNFREDWVGRVTYDFDRRYFVEFNGAYNGSEKFSTDYRFGFFPSLAGGWMLSNEEFFQKALPFVNTFKMRYSWGKIGDDSGIARWQYVSGWSRGTGNNGIWRFGSPFLADGYPFYYESVVANPFVRWESAEKQNIGLETGIFNNLFQFNFDYFWEHRYDMFIERDDRLSNIIFGKDLPAANIGELKSFGWEAELKFSKTNRNSRMWGNVQWARATNEILFREDPELMPGYQKQEGFPIGQRRTHISAGINNNWDEVYTNTVGQTNVNTLPGDYRLIDYNADGVIDQNDAVPYQYTDRPEYNYGFTLGYRYKNFETMLQFYGVYNVTDNDPYGEFHENYSIARAFHLNESWSPEMGRTSDAAYRHLRYNTGASTAEYFIWDYSYFRLQTIEISYNLSGRLLASIGVTNLRIFVSGNNLWIWNKLLEDRDRRRMIVNILLLKGLIQE
jgi:TonB-linked SusC/RagA family outer membrane protein